MKISKRLHRLFCSVVFFQAVLILGAQDDAFGQSQRSTRFPDYYQINQTPTQQKFLDPQGTIESLSTNITAQGGSVFNLLKWDRAGKSLPIPTEPYNRDKHFGTWIDDNRDNNCLDTRGKILVKNSRVAVTYSDAKRCIVATGEWLDPYTNQIFRKATDIQIDHFIPLKQAYTTGAWTWNQKYRCLYANFLFNEIQLLAVNGTENQKKSDNAPDEYMPPNKQIWCGYLANWLKVKLIWNLVMTPPEAKGIADIFAAAKCSAKDFQFTVAELQKQRATITANALYCDYDMKPKPPQ
ncbi:MAG: DUF1524 domain-containing protein [Bdellovibrionota bacterium]